MAQVRAEAALHDVSTSKHLTKKLEFTPVTELLQQGAADGVFPGAVLLVGHQGDVLYHFQVGKKWQEAPEGISNEMQRDTVFDVASLTQPVVTATILMKLIESGKLKLTDRLSRYVQVFGVAGKSSITIEHLLAHGSGLPVWAPFFEELVKSSVGERIGILTSRGARDFITNCIHRISLKNPVGSKQIPSDLGYMLLGTLIEQLTGLSLDKAAQRYVFQPLGMKSSSYVDLAMIKRRGIHPVRDRIAPTEACAWRKRVLCGEVHDDNAWAMGGIAGHSGLFTNASDLHQFATEILRGCRGQSSFVKRSTLNDFLAGPKSFDGDGTFHLGFESPNRENGMDESKLSNQAIGLCSFSGCSLWIDLASGVDIVLLTNRIHPSRNNKQIRAFRPKLHDLVLEALGAQ